MIMRHFTQNIQNLYSVIVSGYGEKGPDKDLPGFDFTAYFARGGIMGTMYDVDSMPMSPIAGFGDHQVGMYLASGILAALYRARETGEGDQVTVSLFHTALWDIALFLRGKTSMEILLHSSQSAGS